MGSTFLSSSKDASSFKSHFSIIREAHHVKTENKTNHHPTILNVLHKRGHLCFDNELAVNCDHNLKDQ